jgi:hypothetical protein
MARDWIERFWSKVARGGTGGCWLWTAGKFSEGYGQFWRDGRNLHAHRVAYELLVGPIPEGLNLDHLCRVRHCVNPAHLEPVTARTNLLRGVGQPARNARKTHCKNGHEFTPENTYEIRPGWRACRQCKRDHDQRRIAADPERHRATSRKSMRRWRERQRATQPPDGASH